jgi:hypothetical protein
MQTGTDKEGPDVPSGIMNMAMLGMAVRLSALALILHRRRTPGDCETYYRQ